MILLDYLALLSVGGLLAVWVVYPLVVAGLGRVVRKPRPARQGGALRVSVIIATREGTPAVRHRVENCLRTTWPSDLLEVVVARDAESMAAGGDDLGLDGPVRVVAGDSPGGKASSLNAGVRAATGSVLVFADTHQRFEPATIPRLVEALSQPGTGAVSGRLSLTPGSGALVLAYWRFERWLRRSESNLHSCIGVTGAVWAMRRELWQPLPAGLILDDVYTPMRVVLGGRRVRFVGDAVAVETRTPDPLQEYGRKVRTLTGVIQLCAWLPAVLVPFRNPVWLQFVCHKLLRLLTPYWLALVGLWALARAWLLLGSAALPMALVVAALAVWFSASARPAVARIRRLLTEAILLQWAVIMAGYNGLRGRWEVWGRGR